MYATRYTGNFTLAVKKVKKRDEVSSVTMKNESSEHEDQFLSFCRTCRLVFFLSLFISKFSFSFITPSRDIERKCTYMHVRAIAAYVLLRKAGWDWNVEPKVQKLHRPLRRNPDPEPRTQNRNARLISLFARATESVSSFLRWEPGLLLFRSFSRI